MKKIAKIFFSLFIVFLFQCAENTEETAGEIHIRLLNQSEFTFENIIVNTYDENAHYESLNSQELSNYKNFEKAYAYSYLQLEINGDKFTIQPIDYVGETPFEPGFYTYEISVDDTREEFNTLSLKLVID